MNPRKQKVQMQRREQRAQSLPRSPRSPRSSSSSGSASAHNQKLEAIRSSSKSKRTTDFESADIVARSVQRSGLSYDSFVRLIIQSALGRLSIWTQADLERLLLTAERLGLDPLSNEIYALENTHGTAKKPQIIFVVGVDGWTKIINSHPQFDGMKFLESEPGDDGLPLFFECTIYRKDRKVATSVREYMYEAHTNQGAWLTHPRRMLRHKAMVQCARVCFGLSGIIDPDEAQRVIMNTDPHKSLDINSRNNNVIQTEKALGAKFVKEWTKKITKQSGDFSKRESTENI